jgi:hypothetical protein
MSEHLFIHLFVSMKHLCFLLPNFDEILYGGPY